MAPKTKQRPASEVIEMIEEYDKSLRQMPPAAADFMRKQFAPPAPPTEAEIALELKRAEMSLRRWGTVDPPTEALYGVLKSTCPQCGKSGLTSEMFGFKKHRGVLRAQSWCKECRAIYHQGRAAEKKATAKLASPAKAPKPAPKAQRKR